MHVALSRNRGEDGVLLQCIVLFLIVVVGTLIMVVLLHLCKMLDGKGGGGSTNETSSISFDVPDAPAQGGVKVKDFTQYRIVLQRQSDGSNWNDIAGVDWNGTATTGSAVTNWTKIGMFRLKAYPIQ